jgi:hypothetical protein
MDHKLDLSAGTNDSMLRHALEPVFRWLGPGLMTFRGVGDGPATSVAHDLIELSLRRPVPARATRSWPRSTGGWSRSSGRQGAGAASTGSGPSP